MATFDDIHAVLDELAIGIDGLEAEIVQLKALVADGELVSQANLDALASRVELLRFDIDETSDQE